jgi:hypothetical protein
MVKHECDKCKRGKRRIATLLQESEQYQHVSVDDDSDKPRYPAQMISELLPEKDYWPDISCTRFFYYDGQRYSKDVIIEVDHIQEGSSSHRSKRSVEKDIARDKHFLSIRIPTVRFTLDKVIGKKAYPDNDILDLIDKEIEYQLR